MAWSANRNLGFTQPATRTGNLNRFEVADPTPGSKMVSVSSGSPRLNHLLAEVRSLVGQENAYAETTGEYEDNSDRIPKTTRLAAAFQLEGVAEPLPAPATVGFAILPSKRRSPEGFAHENFGCSLQTVVLGLSLAGLVGS